MVKKNPAVLMSATWAEPGLEKFQQESELGLRINGLGLETVLLKQAGWRK